MKVNLELNFLLPPVGRAERLKNSQWLFLAKEPDSALEFCKAKPDGVVEFLIGSHKNRHITTLEIKFQKPGNDKTA